MAISDHNLIWVDMEMTGLVPEAHRVIEIRLLRAQVGIGQLAVGAQVVLTGSDAVEVFQAPWPLDDGVRRLGTREDEATDDRAIVDIVHDGAFGVWHVE